MLRSLRSLRMAKRAVVNGTSTRWFGEEGDLGLRVPGRRAVSRIRWDCIVGCASSAHAIETKT